MAPWLEEPTTIRSAPCASACRCRPRPGLAAATLMSSALTSAAARSVSSSFSEAPRSSRTPLVAARVGRSSPPCTCASVSLPWSPMRLRASAMASRPLGLPSTPTSTFWNIFVLLVRDRHHCRWRGPRRASAAAGLLLGIRWQQQHRTGGVMGYAATHASQCSQAAETSTAHDHDRGLLALGGVDDHVPGLAGLDENLALAGQHALQHAGLRLDGAGIHLGLPNEGVDQGNRCALAESKPPGQLDDLIRALLAVARNQDLAALQGSGECPADEQHRRRELAQGRRGHAP